MPPGFAPHALDSSVRKVLKFAGQLLELLLAARSLLFYVNSAQDCSLFLVNLRKSLSLSQGPRIDSALCFDRFASGSSGEKLVDFIQLQRLPRWPEQLLIACPDNAAQVSVSLGFSIVH